MDFKTPHLEEVSFIGSFSYEETKLFRQRNLLGLPSGYPSTESGSVSTWSIRTVKIALSYFISDSELLEDYTIEARLHPFFLGKKKSDSEKWTY